MSVEHLATVLAGRYRIERELGAGGMATVYLAQDVKHHRRIAIKVLHAELSALLGSERFLKEIELTASLQHPHILPLFDSGSADGLLYYVMPFVEGESLRDRLSREKQLPIADAVRMATDVADALAYAHERGVVHRDIKPENILLQDGQPPFTGPNAQAIMAKTLTMAPESLSVKRGTVPAEIVAAVAVALQKLPADRFPTATAFAQALSAPAPAGGTRHSATRAAVRSRSRMPTLALVALALAVGVMTGYWWQRTRSNRPCMTR